MDYSVLIGKHSKFKSGEPLKYLYFFRISVKMTFLLSMGKNDNFRPLYLNPIYADRTEYVLVEEVEIPCQLGLYSLVPFGLRSRSFEFFLLNILHL